MTNWDCWREYTSGLSSPDNYINWSFLYTIAASLQRRVWLGPDHQQVFCNMYVILVGNPGVGKGLPLKEVQHFLKHWPLDITLKAINGQTQEDKNLIETVAETDLKNAQEKENQGKTKGTEMFKSTLIPVCADAITYEALVDAVASSYRRISYTNIEKDNKLSFYGHSSICFVLPELASLLRKRSNDTVNFMLGLYDCPNDYEYTTKTQGKDRIKRGCLNLIAGTTPNFMQSNFDEKLIDEGFTSRTFYIYAQKNRKNQMFIPALTEEQKGYRDKVLQHIKALTGLYGPIRVDPDTLTWLQNWWDKNEKERHTRSNLSLKLLPYYSRKNLHVMKVAMAKHFGDSTEMYLSKEEFEWAIEFLSQEEKNMHLALVLESTNPLAKVANKILLLLQHGKRNTVDLLVDLYSITDQRGLEEALIFLEQTNQIKTTTIHDDTLDKDMIYYELK